MKNILYILAGLLILIAEIAVANKFPIFGATPDLLLVYIVILSRNTDAKSNFIVAAALGFIKDILIGLRFGANIIIFCVVAVVIRFTWWTSVVDWAINIGGKPMWSLAAFIPVIFETTILFAALSSVGAMILINGLPKVNPPIIDPDLSCSKFAIFIPEDDLGFNVTQIEKLFNDLGASEVNRTEF